MTYFLSDAHLGSWAMPNAQQHINRLLQLLSRMEKDAEAIYLLGDIFDFWFEYLWHDPSKEQYTPFLQKIQSLTSKGIQVFFFVGNHDLWTFGKLAKRTGMHVYHNPQTHTIYGKSVYLGHGDGIIPSNYITSFPPEKAKHIKRFIALRRIFHARPLQYLFRLLPPAWGNHIGYQWSAKSRRKELENPCPYLGENKEALVLFAKEQEQIAQHHDLYIFGHRHIELDLQITRNSRVVILGDYFRQYTYAMLTPNGTLTLCAEDE